ncbi:MAG: beta-ketoacyl-ACP synthase III [Actinomycetes bacterium]
MAGIRITGWGIGLPDRIVTNEELSQTLDTSDEWIRERSGIHQRHIGGTTSSLAVIAGRAAMDQAGVTGDDVDMVLLATTTPDKTVPGTAPTVQHALGITGGAVDLNAACSGFVYGLVFASGLIATGAKRVLLIGAETLSRIVDWEDRGTAILFGDGAGALLIEATDDEGDLLSWDLGSDGSLTDLLYCEHGDAIHMEGKEVFRRAVRVMVDSSTNAMSQANVTASDISLVIPHQANMRIIQAACQRLEILEERAVVVMDRYANTSSASIPLAFVDAIENGRIHPGDLLLLTGFGAGMTWASAVLRWPR